MITIREATIDDKPHIIRMWAALQLHEESSNSHLWRVNPPRGPQHQKDVDGMLKEDITLIADNDSAPIAYIHGSVSHRPHLTPATVGFLKGLYVDEGHRRRRVATCLIRALIDKFKERDVQGICLDYVIGNRKAESLWTQLDLKPVIVTANASLDAIEKRLNE